jgi:hypothetical protein
MGDGSLLVNGVNPLPEPVEDLEGSGIELPDRCRSEVGRTPTPPFAFDRALSSNEYSGGNPDDWELSFGVGAQLVPIAPVIIVASDTPDRIPGTGPGAGV